ncbi:MAG: D-aminoacyl-tRNA deacylase [Candidatus Bathyarchaeia archaeon]
MPAIILASNNDPAASNITEKLITNFGFTFETNYEGDDLYRKGDLKLLKTNRDILNLRRLDPKLKFDTVICVSRHSSMSGKPTLTAHTPGNLCSEAPMGGEARRIALADPYRLRSAIISLIEAAEQLDLKDYSVSLEATHHGPTELTVPVLFIEIGSTPKHWLDMKAGEAAASATLRAAMESSIGKSAVGFGGGHYAPKHTRYVVEEGFAVGHIIPEHFFEEYEPNIVDSAFRKTVGGCRTALVDWKGLKSEHRRILLSRLGLIDVEIIKS